MKIANVSDVKKIEPAVRQRDLFAARAPSFNTMLQFVAAQNFVMLK